MGRERLWDQGSLCLRGLGTQKGWVWQRCPQPGDTRSRLSSPPSLASWFIGATCLFYRALNPLRPSRRGEDGHTTGHQELLGYEHLDTSGFHPPTPTAATWHKPGTELMHRDKPLPTAPEMPNKGSCQAL